MSGLVKGALVQVVQGPLRGVQGVVESLEGSNVRVRVSDLPPRLERSEIGAYALIRAVDLKVIG